MSRNAYGYRKQVSVTQVKIYTRTSKIEMINENVISPDIIKKLVDDQDPDVRVRGCRLIEHLWHLYVHEKHEQKKRTNYVPQSVFFEHIQAGELLTLAVSNTNRCPSNLHSPIYFCTPL